MLPSWPVVTTAQEGLLEEIIVSARKRDERLQDVPLAIAAATGEQIRELALDDMAALSSTMPNVFITRTIKADDVTIRGLGSGNNSGIEQAVGTVIDGIFYGSRRFSRIGFFDIERVEVLKGPQGALIGKNTTAGALNITTARPTDEFEANLTAEYEITEAEGVTVEGAVSGPLSDTFSARAAFRVIEANGYMDNIATREEDPDISDWMGRVSLQWEPSDNITALFQYTHFDSEYKGGDQQAWMCNAAQLTYYVSRNVPLECDLNLKRKEVAPVNGVGNAEIFTSEIDTAAVTIDWELDNGFSITSLTAWGKLEGWDRAPADKTPLELGNTRLFEDYEQWSQEVRLASPTGNQFEYLIGVYYQTREQHSESTLDINFIPVSPPRPPIAFSSPVFTDEKVDHYAAFGQITWNVTEQWAFTVDGRYTYEEKDADQVEFPAAIYSLVPTGPNVHVLSRSKSENAFTPGFTVQWKPTDDMNYYASFRTGFKSGGFNHQISAVQAIADLSFEFADEEVDAYEVGAKLTFPDQNLQVNTALFRSEFTNLQVDIFDNTVAGIPFQRVSNAGEALTQGVEVDATWYPTENLRLFFAGAYLDATYESYPGAQCYFGQTPALGCSVGPDGMVGTRDDSQDLAGGVLKWAPDWAATINAEYTWPVSSDLELVGFIQGIYTDNISVSDDNDPALFQAATWKLDARVTLRDAGGMWDVSIIGRNLTDELALTSGSDTAGIVPGHSYNVRIDPPISLILQGRVRF